MSPVLKCDDLGILSATSSELPVEHARRVAAVLDEDIDLREGTELPLLWHWAFFASPVATSGLGDDGHPRMSEGGATSGLRSRMWAGGRVEGYTPLRVGRPAVRHSLITHTERKSGRSGDLLVVTVEHQIEQDDQVAIVEIQDLIYRGSRSEPMVLPATTRAIEPPTGGWSEVVIVDPVQLFRFSAITFNSHRIHYDLPYATAEEGYPGLVVHGPLAAMLLLRSAHRSGGMGMSFEFRARAPLFANYPLTLVGRPEVNGMSLEAIRVDGVTAMTALLG